MLSANKSKCYANTVFKGMQVILDEKNLENIPQLVEKAGCGNLI